MRSIRAKITAIAIFAILTSVLAVFVVYNYSFQAENDRHSAEMMNLLAENTRRSLDKYFESIEQSVEMTANIATDTLDVIMLVENGAAGPYSGQNGQTPEQKQKLDTYLAEYSDRIQEAFSSVANHTHGVVTYYYCFTPEMSDAVHGFFFSKVGKTGFDEQEPLDARELDPEDIEHTTWYYTPIRRGRPSWVGPYTAHFLGEMWICSYLVPIYKAGQLIGVLGMDIPLDTLISQISPIRVYKTGYACLCDEDGRILYHPQMEQGSIPDIEELPSLSEMFRNDNSGNELIRYTIGGEERQMAFSTLSNGLKLVITAPTAEIAESWMRLVRLILAVTAGITAFYVVLLPFVMRAITRPLQRLTSASQRLADGDYEVELNYESRDEIGVLTKAFIHMRDQLKLYIDDLNRRIRTDALTGLPKIRYFFLLAENERKRLLEAGKAPVMLYFNLIGMKHYNRQYGFEEGDRLIRAFADLLVRRYNEETITRLSADHFAVVTEENHLEEELLSFFEECESINKGKMLPVRVGIYPERLGWVNVSVACDRAKYACDQSRGSYVSGYCWFDTTMLKHAENTRYIISHLDEALKEEWIKVYYQPIIRAANGRVCDEEALSRWIDPVRGILSPGDFIPILEEARLIDKLDLYVLDRILIKMHEQKKAGLKVVPHSLNLSRVDFEVCDIVDEICRRVDASGIPREKLTIEVTESVVGSDFDFMKEQIRRFHDLGFSVWMDDFGSGYSSLDVLQDIRFDLIKFDMRFMQRFSEGNESRIILTQLVKMAVGLGIDTVTEGVETKEEVDFLREIGCTKLQGYYYGKAIPFEEILDRNRQGILIDYEDRDE